MDKDKKENFRMALGLVLAATQYAVLKFTYHRYSGHAQLKLWNRVLVKSKEPSSGGLKYSYKNIKKILGNPDTLFNQ